MRLSLLPRLLVGTTGSILFILPGGLALRGVAGEAAVSTGPAPVVTQVRALEFLSSEEPGTNHTFDLEGDIWWANLALGRIVLHDSSGTEEIQAELPGSGFKTGDRIRLTGTGTIVRRGAAFQLGPQEPVVDNDGIHSLTEKSGSIYLSAGLHPIRVQWFNGVGKLKLNVEYEGCGLGRQKIPSSALRRRELQGSGAESRRVSGLDYAAYEGNWSGLPEFDALKPVKAGTVADFDVGVRTRDRGVALQFSGDVEIARDGMYRFYLKSDDGSRLFVGEPTLRLAVTGKSAFPSARAVGIGELLSDEAADGQWAQVEGKVTFALKRPGSLRMELRAGAGSLLAELGDDSGLSVDALLNRRVRAVGFCQGAFNLAGERVAGALLIPSSKELRILDGESATAGAGVEMKPAGLPVLTTASSVRELKTEDARRGYPLKIQGVVTGVQPDRQAFVIQDSTVGLYVAAGAGPELALPGIGEFLEIEGVTDEPGIARLRAMKRLGRGTMPEPLHPAWDQLMNGSLDSQWVEISGLVESLVDRSNGWTRVMLRTRAGTLKVDVRRAGVRPGALEQYENAVVRLRGCMFADWHPNGRLKVGQVRMYDADVLVDQAAMEDVFELPGTSAGALMQFDPKFDVSRRVKVAVQVVYARGADYFTMDGKDGLRFQARQPLGLEAGDLVEAVGFPELSGAAPVLRGAVARKTGHAALPKPTLLSPDDLTRANLDSTCVRVQGLLTGLRQTSTNLVLELQAGTWRFLARLNAAQGVLPLQVGSRLELTGVYCAQGGYQALGADVAQMDLLVNQPLDIRVLSRPPWWTLERMLVAMGALACAAALMVLWISQLRRQVEERTAELGTQIRHREQVELQRRMEQERARIAQDLHDQLGSDIATVSMLASRAQIASAPDEKRNQYLDQVRGTAREMVASLDEIVWAMNPVHDSLASLESYLGRYADRFLGLANITWRFDGPSSKMDCPVDFRLRHQLFLACKEALTNVARHSGASEVRLGLQVEDGHLRIAIADNGRGFAPPEPGRETNGVANMRSRIEKLNGRFEIEADSGRGTTVRFCIPLK